MALIENEVNDWLDKIGMPRPHDVCPTPAEVCSQIGIPTPAEMVRRVMGDVKGKVGSLKGRLF